MIFGNGYLLRFAVDGGRRGKDDAVRLTLAHHLQQVQGTHHICVVVFLRLLPTLPYQAKSGEVDHRIDRIALKASAYVLQVSQISAEKLPPAHSPFVPGAEIVEDDVFFSRLRQSLAGM